MSLPLGLPLLLLAAVLQSTVFSQLRAFGGQPDLVVVIVLAWSILDSEGEGMAWAFAGGLLLDVLSGAPLGLSSLVLLPVAYLVGLSEAQLYRANVGLLLLLGAGGSLAYHVLYVIALRLLGGIAIPWPEGIWYVTLPSVILDVCLIIPAVRLLGRWHDRLHPRQVKL